MSKMFNPETVKGLRKLGEPGKDSFAEQAGIYLKQAPKEVARIETHLNSREFKELCDIARQLKSSSRNLGAESLVDLFRRLEEAAHAGDAENMLRVFPALKKEFGNAIAELAKLVGPNAA